MLTERQLLAEAAVGSATAELRMLVDGCQFFSSGAVLPICEIPIQLTRAESILNSRYSADPLVNFCLNPNCAFGAERSRPWESPFAHALVDGGTA